MNIGILGGTFDPVHNGHLFLARQAKKQCALHKVFFIPTNIPPHKFFRQDLTSPDHRLRMLRLALLGDKDFEVCTEEIDRGGISYTIDTVRALKKRFASDQLCLILGEDNFNEIHTWRGADEIQKSVRLLIASRELGKICKRKNIAGVSWIDMPFCPYSSSEIRERLKKNEAVIEMLPCEVEKYIRQNKLYLGA